MRKLLPLLLLSVFLIGCGDDKPRPHPTPLPSPIVTPEATPQPTVEPTPVSTPVSTPATARATPFPTPNVDVESYLPPIPFAVVLTILLVGFGVMKQRTRGRFVRELRRSGR